MIGKGRPSKLSEIQKREIRVKNNGGEPQHKIALEYGVSIPTINRICKEKK